MLNTDHSTDAQIPDPRTQNSDAFFPCSFLKKQKNLNLKKSIFN